MLFSFTVHSDTEASGTGRNGVFVSDIVDIGCHGGL